MNILDWIDIFLELKDEEKQNLSLFCQEKNIKEWEIIFNEGDESSAMYIVKKWNIEITKTINNKETVLWKVKEQDLIWEMAFFWKPNSKRSATAKALTECKLITILFFSIDELTKKHPELLEKIKLIVNNRKIINESIK